MRALCINLNRRPDRWERFIKQVTANWPMARPEHFAAVDGCQTPPPGWWKSPPGAWGCFRSHLRAVETALSDGMEEVAIFEDDATFSAEFGPEFREFMAAVPDDWELIYLGGEHLERHHRAPQRADGYAIPHNVNRLHAYMLSRAGLEIVYRHLTQLASWTCRHHVDHRIGELQKSRAIKVYCPPTWLVGQSAGLSDITMTTAPERWWNTAEYWHTPRGF